MNNGWPNDIDNIAKVLNNSGFAPPEHIRKDVLRRCRRYNYVWVGKIKVTRLESHEIEYIMGYPHDHTSIRENLSICNFSDTLMIFLCIRFL